jgi:hypothetical protein
VRELLRRRHIRRERCSAAIVSPAIRQFGMRHAP